MYDIPDGYVFLDYSKGYDPWDIDEEQIEYDVDSYDMIDRYSDNFRVSTEWIPKNIYFAKKDFLNNESEEINMKVTAKRTGTKVTTGKVRLSYAHLFEPHAMNDGQEPKYSVSVIIPKSDKETLKAIKEATDAAKELGKDKWKGKIPANLKTPLRDGDTEREDEAYAGCYFLNANSKNKPGIVDVNVQPILDATEVYSGCYARLTLNFYPYSASGNNGIACGLGNVQKLEDGEPLGGFSRAEDDFDAIGEAEDDFLG